MKTLTFGICSCLTKCSSIEVYFTSFISLDAWEGGRESENRSMPAVTVIDDALERFFSRGRDEAKRVATAWESGDPGTTGRFPERTWTDLRLLSQRWQCDTASPSVSDSTYTACLAITPMPALRNRCGQVPARPWREAAGRHGTWEYRMESHVCTILSRAYRGLKHLKPTTLRADRRRWLASLQTPRATMEPIRGAHPLCLFPL